MIEINNTVSIKQIIKKTNNTTGEINYLILDENNQVWKELTEKEYNQIRGNLNG